MRVRYYEPHDYEMVQGWWQARKHAVLAPEALPRIGVVVEDKRDGRLLAASWLFLAGTTLGLIDWTVTRPEMAPWACAESVRRAVESLELIAEALGIRTVFAISGSRGLSKLMVRSGYEQDPKPHSVLVKFLGANHGS